MATGSGKTVVMAMLIAWHALNKLANPQDARFSDAFLIVTPGITIRDRLRVLLPNDPDNYYRQRDLVPPDLLEQLGRAKIVITNFHAFKLRETRRPAKLTKAILSNGDASAFTETPGQMVSRVCRELGQQEEHRRPQRRGPPLLPPQARRRRARSSRATSARRPRSANEEARVWISGLEAIKAKIGIKAVYDLSATPFFLRGSGYPEGTLFPWVVSDFSLIDAIESRHRQGAPRAGGRRLDDRRAARPTATSGSASATSCPRRAAKTEAVSGEPKLPVELAGGPAQPLRQLREVLPALGGERRGQGQRGLTPPVFIVVCNNTNVSKLVFDYIAGWEKTLADGTTVAVPGSSPIFSNVDGRPLVGPPEHDPGGQRAARIGRGDERRLQEDRRPRDRGVQGRVSTRASPAAMPSELTDEDLLREVMNTVGKPGKLGEHVRCVVSVSMLTEGWDANTVTHILGVRAFGTQLLCEQVVGRACAG